MSPNAHKLDNYNDNNRFCCLMLRYERAHAQAKEFSSGREEGVLVQVQSDNYQLSLPCCGAPYQCSMKFLTQKTKWANISPPSKRNLNGEMAFPWRNNDGPTLNAGSVVYD